MKKISFMFVSILLGQDSGNLRGLAGLKSKRLLTKAAANTGFPDM